MITLESIKQSLIQMLSITGLTIYGENNENQLIKPCLLVDIIPITSTRQNPTTYDKATLFDIVYLTKESKKIDNYNMIDSLQDILSASLDVDDRHLSILELSFNIVNNILHTQFKLNYLDGKIDTSPMDTMNKLKITIGE